MAQRMKLMRIAGVALLALAVWNFQAVFALAERASRNLVLPVYLAQGVLLALALDWMGALRRDLTAASCGVAAAGALAFYALGGWQRALSAHGDAIQILPAAPGRLLFGVCLVLCVRALLQRRFGGREELVRGLALLALVLLASLATLLQRKFSDVALWGQNDAAAQALLGYTWVFCLFLLPFLGRQDRFAGWALALIGLTATAVLHAMTVSPLFHAAQAEDANALLRGLRLAYSRLNAQIQLFAMLGLGGVALLLPRKPAVGRQRK